MQQDEYIKLGSVNVRYRTAGDSGTAVLLIHGIACSVQEWDRNIAALARQHRVFALDLLGFGLTDMPANEDYSLDRLAQFILDFMTAANVGQAHLCGNSLGGRLALLCAAMAPQRILSTVLVDPAGIEQRGTLAEFRLATLPGVGELLTHPTAFATRMLWRKAFCDPAPFVTDEFVTHQLTLARRPGAQSAFLKTLRGFVNLRGFRPGPVAALHAALPQLNAPCLVIWGENDQFVPARHARLLQQTMQDITVQIFPHCGHLPQIELAERFNATVLRFWRDVDAR